MIPPCALFCLVGIMQALAPLALVGALMRHLENVGSLPPAASPCLVVASGYSSHRWDCVGDGSGHLRALAGSGRRERGGPCHHLF